LRDRSPHDRRRGGSRPPLGSTRPEGGDSRAPEPLVESRGIAAEKGKREEEHITTDREKPAGPGGADRSIVAGGEPGRSQRISILEGSFAQVHIAITGGSLVTAYALMLGASDFDLGLLAGLTALSTVGSILGAHWVGILGRRKPLSVASSVAGRVLWSLLSVLPFLGLSPIVQLALFLATVFVGNTLVNLSGTAWLSWMTDLVPIERRGHYFGLRNTILGGVGMAATYAAGRAFDLFVARGERPFGLAVIFGAAAFFAASAGVVLTRQWEPPLRGERPRPLAETMRRPFANRGFRRLLLFMTLWSVATGIAGPFFAAHMIKNLGMSFSAIAFYSIVAGGLNLLTLPIWGKVIDRVGNRPVLVLNLLGVFYLPLLWLFAGPQRFFPIWLDAGLTGLFWPGFTLAWFNLVLATAPEENRTAYLGMQSMAVGFSTFGASILGGLIASRLGDLHATVLGIGIVNFHVLFLLSALARAALLPLALTLREDRARPFGAVLGLAGDQVSQRFSQGWQIGLAIIRRIGRP
jgi:MFS family permease